MSYNGVIEAMLRDGRQWIQENPGCTLSFKSPWGDNEASRSLSRVVAEHNPSMGQATGVLSQLRREYIRHWGEG